MNQEELAIAMNYGKNYISEMLSPTGKVSAKFVTALRLRFAQYLENPKTIASEPQASYGPQGGAWLNLTEAQRILAQSNKTLADGHMELIGIIKSLNLGELVKASLPASDSEKGNSPGIAVVPLGDKKLPPRGSAKKKERQKDKV